MPTRPRGSTGTTQPTPRPSQHGRYAQKPWTQPTRRQVLGFALYKSPLGHNCTHQRRERKRRNARAQAQGSRPPAHGRVPRPINGRVRAQTHPPHLATGQAGDPPPPGATGRGRKQRDHTGRRHPHKTTEGAETTKPGTRPKEAQRPRTTTLYTKPVRKWVIKVLNKLYTKDLPTTANLLTQPTAAAGCCIEREVAHRVVAQCGT